MADSVSGTLPNAPTLGGDAVLLGCYLWDESCNLVPLRGGAMGLLKASSRSPSEALPCTDHGCPTRTVCELASSTR